MTVKVKATMLAIITADLYVDNLGYNNTTLIEASEYARLNWTPELEAEAAIAVNTVRSESISQTTDAHTLVFGNFEDREPLIDTYPLLDVYLDKCIEAMNV